ncbi:RNA ligase family protein [Streptomyces sp. NPDC007083]|uniref:ATP-dependent DNA ligase n=1 Tax=Streptomyces sp. NPDC007083 TaxID=3156913 RepID=UPI0033F38046
MWSVEPKLNGWRCVLFRYENVVLQARSGRIITERLPEIAEAARRLPEGVVLDGEAVAYRNGRIDFGAMQRRALASPRRSAALADTIPATYAAFDLLQDETGADLRMRPYADRRAALLSVLESVGPPIEPVPATTDPEVALGWWEAGPAGIEGLVLKHPRGLYRGAARDWIKIKHQ